MPRLDRASDRGGRFPRAALPALPPHDWGSACCLFGIAAGWVAAALAGRLEPGLIATMLAALIVLYDGVLKPTILAPVAMGGCRTLNVLLGMSAAAADLPQLEPGTAWQQAAWLVAAGIGVYIAGVTWFARSEADTSHRGQLLAGTLVMLAGVGMVGFLSGLDRAESDRSGAMVAYLAADLCDDRGRAVAGRFWILEQGWCNWR